MRFLPLRVPAAAALLFFWPAVAPAADYYVSTRGRDTNAGTLGAPWRTVRKAAETLVAGDTVWIRGGLYRELVTPKQSGSAADGWITYRAYGKEKPVLDAAGLRPSEDGESAVFLLRDRSYVRVQGLELRNFATLRGDLTPCGIFVAGACDHIELLGNRIHHINTFGKDGNALGLAVYGDSATPITNLVIDGNEVRNCRLGSSESLVLNGNVTGFQVTNNHVHHNNNIGIDFAGFEGTCPDPAQDRARDGVCRGNIVDYITSNGNPAYGRVFAADGIYVDGGARIVIERNVVHHCDIGVELASEHANGTTEGVELRENVVYGNRVGGLFLGGYDEQRGKTINCDIHHNTFYHNDTRSDGNGELYFQHFVTGCTIRHNIFSAYLQKLLIGSPYQDSANNHFDYNLYFAPGAAADAEWQVAGDGVTGLGAYQTKSGEDAHSLFADPKFVNAARLNFHLGANSPAKDAGDPAFAPGAGETDLDGAARVNGTAVDIGADEF
ncbi:MAG TPA: right-handed parallel beta-helix repeat-containing protein [Chthoniobacteraceae bacterium]|nr:right-handed parallel beta-helix repeat-containing protein [Chthoniobacteraceae bacterium]